MYNHDPHIDPQLSWAGKSERTSFEVPTVSLHVHERIDPRTIIEAVRKRNGEELQNSLFESLDENPPIRTAIEFYKHSHSWTNRLIAGDSLLVMNSLLEKEGLGGQIQTVFIDPPYGIRYRSNFQPFVNRKDVKERDEDLTVEPEQIRAFRDTWQLGIHSYLTYLRDRLLLAHDLLSERGHCFVQIGDENVSQVHQLMNEIFGAENLMSLVSFRTKIPLNAAHLPNIADYLVWFAKDKPKAKFRRLFLPRAYGSGTQFSSALLSDGREVNAREVPDVESKTAKYFRLIDLMATGYTESCHFDFNLDGRTASPNPTTSWKTTPEGMERLIAANRVRWLKTVPGYVFFADDYPVMELTNQWVDTQGASGKTYAVQTATKIVERCILMTSDPGDLVFDPTCGSGTTAYVAEQWGRRWITCDTSRVAVALAKQRLMTAGYSYYELARENEGVDAGFVYNSVPHVTLGAIANNGEIQHGMSRDAIEASIARNAPKELLYDQPLEDRSKTRVAGPFTVEAVPAPAVRPIDDVVDSGSTEDANESLSRTGETLRQEDWREELLKSGVRGKAGQQLTFVRLEPLPGARWLQAEGESRIGPGITDNTERVVISFGPDYAPLEQRQVAHAIEEALALVPQPKIVMFAAFQFDPEASKDIDETKWPGVSLLKIQMNADLLTTDLKKTRSNNESFWLIGQPDVVVRRVVEGADEGKIRISVQGFDYFNTRTGNIESGGSEKIAMWMLDPDYDGRSLFARQVFFPMASAKDGWAKLARNLKAEIDSRLLESYRGTESLAFEAGVHSRAAVKIVDDRGIESLKIVDLT